MFIDTRHVAFMKNSFDGRLPGFLSSLVSHWESAGSAVAIAARTIHLKRDAVIRLEEKSGAKAIEIKSGTVWLTSTPANGDVLLHTGACFETAASWPYVIQAMEPTEILLLTQPD